MDTDDHAPVDYKPAIENTEGIYSIVPPGICMWSVCALNSLDVDEVMRQANMMSPTGISSRWQLSDDQFADGHPNPSPCDQLPESRTHYLLEC